METLIQITSNYFCCGVVAIDKKISIAAPIVKYMIGWDGNKFKQYCKSKNWTYNVISSNSR